MANIAETYHYYQIELVKSNDGFRAAQRWRAKGNILLYCLNMVGTGFKAEFFDYEKVGDIWVVNRGDDEDMRQFGVEREYLPGTPEYEAFEQLSNLELEAIC